jgi:hypothetical protein
MVYSRAGTCKETKWSRESSYVAPQTGAAYFGFNSPEANEFCSHEPRGMTYMASDGLEYACPDKPIEERWVFDG